MTLELPSPIPNECRWHYDPNGRIKSDWDFHGNVYQVEWETMPPCLLVSVENYEIWAKSRHYQTFDGVLYAYPAWVALVRIETEQTWGSDAGMYTAEFVAHFVLPSGQRIRTAIRGLLSRYVDVEIPDVQPD